MSDHPMWRELSAKDLGRLCPSAAVKTMRHRAEVYAQGDHCGSVFGICDGEVKLAQVNREGNELTIGLLAVGDMFGPGLADPFETEAQESATARGTVSLWKVPADEWQALLVAVPTIGVRLIRAYANRQRQLERRLACMAFQRTETRLAETLRELSGGFDRRCEHGFGQHLRITQQELADLVGATRPVVSTILNRLRDQGILGYSREYLCVRDIDSIERLLRQ
jgi:CRP/FNR family transcriptional regulator, cyclic AMP receptor protein